MPDNHPPVTVPMVPVPIRRRTPEEQVAYMTGKTAELIGDAAGLRARIAALESELARVKEDVAHALAEAKRYQPDYPWKQNTAAEVAWALGTSYQGVCAANADLHKELARVKGELELAVHNRQCHKCHPAPALGCAEIRVASFNEEGLRRENGELRAALKEMKDFAAVGWKDSCELNGWEHDESETITRAATLLARDPVTP